MSLMKSAVKFLSFGVLCGSAVADSLASGTPPSPEQLTLLATSSAAALKAGGQLAGELVGGLLHEKLFAKQSDLLNWACPGLVDSFSLVD